MIHWKKLLTAPFLVPIILALGGFGVYRLTLAPTVSFIDSGELATVACTLGIAHPTGYPLFTLLGWVFSRLPIAAEEIVRLNLMAAFFCATGLIGFYHLVRYLLELVGRSPEAGRTVSRHQPEALVTGASAGATLLLGFSGAYWSQAVAVEVYSLHLLLLSVVCYTFLRASFPRPADGNKGEGMWWHIFAFCLGLSFANHMTTILLAPGLLYLYFATQGSTRKTWERIGVMSAAFLTGFSAYLYLPIRAAQSPLMNWGNPTTLERFLWHFSGKQYRVWIFSSTEAAGRQLKYFLTALPEEFANVGIVLALFGIVVLWRAQRKALTGLLLLFLGCVLYSINYDIHDIDSYFLLAYLTVGLFAGCGLWMIGLWMTRRTGWNSVVVAFLMLVPGLFSLVYHFKACDESDNYLVEDYTKNMFLSLGDSAVVLSYQWDYWVSAAFYYQDVKGVRPDVAVIDKELLRRSWYVRNLEKRHPWLIRESKPEVDSYLKELYKFEHDLLYNGGAIQVRYVGMITSFIERSMRTRPVYVTAEIEPEYTRGFQRVPVGLAFRLYSDTLFHRSEVPRISYRPLGKRGRLEDIVRRLYAEAFFARGEYYAHAGEGAEAERAFGSAQLYDPSKYRAKNLVGPTRK